MSDSEDNNIGSDSVMCDGTIMFSLSHVTSPYLYPCLVQYCVLCTGVLLTMWRNVTSEHKTQKHRGVGDGDKMCGDYVSSSCQRYNVDCNGSHAGLFCGVVIVVLTIVSIILTFVFSSSSWSHDHDPDLLSSLVTSLSDLVLYTVATVAVLIGTCQIRLD